MTLFRGLSFVALTVAPALFFNSWAQSPALPASGAKSEHISSAVPMGSAADSTVLMRGPAGEVTLGQVRAAVLVFVPASQRERFFDNPRNIEQLALSVYTRQALAAEAKEKGFDQQAEIAKAADIAKMQLIGDLWLLERSKEGEPTPEQLEKYARSIFNAQPSQKSKDGTPLDFESQRTALMEQARSKLVSQARAEVWTAAQAGAEPVADAIAAQVTAPADK